MYMHSTECPSSFHYVDILLINRPTWMDGWMDGWMKNDKCNSYSFLG